MISYMISRFWTMISWHYDIIYDIIYDIMVLDHDIMAL